MKRSASALLGIVLVAAACTGGTGDDADGTPTPTPTPTPKGSVCQADEELFEEAWIDGDGGDCATEPDLQVQRVDANTWVLRQSICTNFEGPFLYLLFGDDKVLLEDTGASNVDVRGTVEDIVATWLAENGRTTIDRVIVNSHAHGDHTFNNADFAGQPDTVVVGTTVTAVSDFFGIANWPTDTATYDLGGRALEIIPIPGHQATHIAIYDPATGWLLTGDTVYPGRLYISDFDTYVTSIQRLLDETAEKEVCQVMGTHIEMSTTPGDDYPFQADQHPNEHALPLSRDHLIELRDAVVDMQGNPAIEPHDDFIVYPL